MNRSDRRAANKDTQTYYRRRGIGLNDNMMTLAFLTRRLINILDNKDNAFRASDVANEAQAAFERTISGDAPPIACAKGCSYCCHTFVSASPTDIFGVARHIRDIHQADFEAELDRICASEDNTRNVSQDAQHDGRQPCALLIDDSCSVYEARPTGCRGWASTDVIPCQNWADDIPVPELYRESRGAIDHAVWAALKHHGYSKISYEISQAIRVALEDPDSEKRWLDGEDVFKDVRIDRSVTDNKLFVVGDQLMDALIDGAFDRPMNFRVGA